LYSGQWAAARGARSVGRNIFDLFVMKKFSFRPQALLLAFALLLTAPVLWSCNAETDYQKSLRLHEEQMKVIDEDTIVHYLRRNNIQNFTRTNSGLYVVHLTDSPQGTPVEKGKQVRLRYVGKFLSNGAHPESSGYPASPGNPSYPAGSIFDNSADNHTACGCVVYTAGSGTVPGFTEGLLLMRKGERKLFLIPSRLAYGPGGANGLVPPDAALLFDVEVLDVF